MSKLSKFFGGSTVVLFLAGSIFAQAATTSPYVDPGTTPAEITKTPTVAESTPPPIPVENLKEAVSETQDVKTFEEKLDSISNVVKQMITDGLKNPKGTISKISNVSIVMQFNKTNKKLADTLKIFKDKAGELSCPVLVEKESGKMTMDITSFVVGGCQKIIFETDSLNDPKKPYEENIGGTRISPIKPTTTVKAITKKSAGRK